MGRGSAKDISEGFTSMDSDKGLFWLWMDSCSLKELSSALESGGVSDPEEKKRGRNFQSHCANSANFLSTDCQRSFGENVITKVSLRFYIPENLRTTATSKHPLLTQTAMYNISYIHKLLWKKTFVNSIPARPITVFIQSLAKWFSILNWNHC